MGWFIIVGAILIVSVIVTIILDNHYFNELLEIFSATLAILSALALICMGLSLVNKNTRFEAFINDYEFTKELVESYDGSEYGNMSTLTGKIIQLNKVIGENKAFVHNGLSGVWYSEKIAELEPIKYHIGKSREPASE